MKKLFLSLMLVLMTGVTMAESRVAKLRDNMLNNHKYVTVVAHRGDWRTSPENSIPAFQSCIDMGVDMIELDIKKTSDGVIVVMHDKTLDRCTNGKGKVSDYTYAELSKLWLRAQHGACNTRHKIPTLEEALLLCKGKVLVNVDHGYNYFQDVMKIAEKTGTTDHIVIKSGKTPKQVMAENANVLEKVIYMPVISLDKDGAPQQVKDNLAMKPFAIECCFRNYTPQVETLLREIQDAGVKVWINTIWPSLCAGHDDDRAVEMKEADEAWGWVLERGATLIQTDRPADLITYLKKNKVRKLK